MAARAVRWRYDITSLVVGAGIAALIVAVGPTSWLPEARAVMASSCLDAHTGTDDDYGQTQVEESDGSTSNDLRGIKADVYFPNPPPDCQRISSLYVFSPTRNGFFEFGIVMGYSTCLGTSSVELGNSVFSAYKPNSGGGDCQVWRGDGAGAGIFRNLRASDVDGNTMWGGYVDGQALQPYGIDLDFAHGFGGVNVERGNPQDQGHAEFQQIYEHHASNGWTYTDDLSTYRNIDPDYHPVIDANEHHVTVTHN
jgi:hypothetical protein